MSACIPGERTSWTARTTTATDLVGGWWLVVRGKAGLRPACLVLLFCVAASIAAAQNPRSHTRLDPRGTRVTQSQAETLTLTLGTAEVRLLQTWVRTAGTMRAGMVRAVTCGLAIGVLAGTLTAKLRISRAIGSI